MLLQCLEGFAGSEHAAEFFAALFGLLASTSGLNLKMDLPARGDIHPERPVRTRPQGPSADGPTRAGHANELCARDLRRG